MIIRNSKEIPDPSEDLSRIVIIGGGTLGLYLARELVRRGQRVLVVEAGGENLDSFPPETYASVGKPHQGLRLGRGRTLGGTSNLWGGQLVEFQPVDLEGRDWLKSSKWPISYEQLARFHRRTYENLGIPSHYLNDSTVWKGVRNDGLQLTEGLEVFLTRWMKVPSVSVAYREEVQNSEALTVLLNHVVTGFTAKAGKIKAVRLVGEKGTESFVHGKQFILAAGTIETCRLLLHAARSPDWVCPWRNNPNLGVAFQDHPVGRIGGIKPLDPKRFFRVFSTLVVSGYKFQPKLRLSNDTLKKTRILNAQAMMSWESSVSENLVYLKQFLKAVLYSRKIRGLGDVAKNVRACGRHILPLMWKYVVDNRVFVPSSSKISLVIQTEQTPLPESKVTINPAVQDKFGLPQVLLDWRLGDAEFSTVREFASRTQTALRNADLAELEIDSSLLAGDKSFLDKLHDNYHHAGGTRMGTSESDGVVDSDLRVFGTDNLYVAGASTFRTASNANTTFTALALGTRLVDHLSIKETSA